ncbi:MAG: sulfite exporter TauE/SafE family protein, partial [Prevotella sp.]|nr:sulfite exporter TauE/SafE family protein [Prevotella sp.]
MDWLYSLLDNSSVPVVTAMILGILTAVSPCPLATNLTAVAYLGREIDNRRKVFYLG